MRQRRRLLTFVGGLVLLTALLAAPMARAVVPLPSVPPLPSLPLPLPSLPLPSVPPPPSPPLPSLPLPTPLPTLPLLPTPLPTLPLLPTVPPLVPTPAPTPSTSQPSASPESTESTDGSAAPTPSDDGAGGAGSSPATSPDDTADAVSPGNRIDPGDDETPAGALDGLVVPGLALGVPMLLVIAFLVAQMIGGVALLPALRRTLGSIGLRDGSMAASVPEEPGGSEASS